MGFIVVSIIGILLTLIGFWKRKKNCGKIFLVIGILFLLITLYMIFLVKFKMTKGLE